MLNVRKYVADNSEKVERLISRAEIAGLLLTLTAVLLMFRKIALGSQFLIIGLSLLAYVYAILGVFSREVFELKERNLFSISLYASYMGLAITTMGILFLMMRWPGASTMVYAGSISTGILFLYLLYKMYFGSFENEAHRTIMNNLMVRMLPALLIVGFLFAIYLRT